MTDLIKFGSLEVRIEDTGNSSCVVVFDGIVNESFKPNSIVEQLTDYNQVTLELSKINTYNSCGIREWIDFISQLKEDTKLIFKDCSIAVIDQINMVPNILGHGSITSFYAPYYCECSGEQSKHIDIERNKDKIENNIAPDFQCDSCNEQLEFDAIEESFFSFISNKNTIKKVS